MTHTATSEDRSPVRTVPWFGAMQVWKRKYERLHPSTQMIGLQLWLPLLFVVLFILCYVVGFHSPALHNAPVGVVGKPAATQISQAMDHSMPGSFDISALSGGAADESTIDAVRSGKLAAAYDPTTPGGPTLIIGSANGESNAEFIQQIFTATAAAGHATLQVKDVAPLPTRDLVGTVALYVSLVATIGGYMIGMFVAMMGTPLKRRVRVGILALTIIPLSLLATILVETVGALSGHFLPLWGILFGTMAAVALAVNGLGYYFNRFVTGIALVLFVFLNIPAAGGAMATDLVPEPFRWLSHVVVGEGPITMIRHVFYNAGPGLHVGLIRLGAYAAVGLLLTLPGPAYLRWRHRRRTLLGLPAGGMMAHAQQQLMADAQAAAQAAHEPKIVAEDASGTFQEAQAVAQDNDDAERA